MKAQNQKDFKRIEEAIYIIKNNIGAQLSLDEVAKKVHVSPAHFQKMFTEWAGVSPKKFAQYLTISHAKIMLGNRKENNTSTLFETAIHTGLSGTGRLHDLFISIEGMTPGEYKKGGENLKISYSFNNTLFGEIIIASTNKGICHVAFIDEKEEGLNKLISCFPNALFIEERMQIHDEVLAVFTNDSTNTSKIKLHIKGSPFQIKVWEALLKIEAGKLSTYGNIADDINSPNAARAVGSAIGQNPIAYLIPCHRVIRNTGIIGEYMWGTNRKTAMIGWEAVANSMEKEVVI